MAKPAVLQQFRYYLCKSSCFKFVCITLAGIRHTHILLERGAITRKLGGGFRYILFFRHRITSMPEACGSVTCTLREDHTAGRQADLCCNGCQVTFFMSSAAANPSRGHR